VRRSEWGIECEARQRTVEKMGKLHALGRSFPKISHSFAVTDESKEDIIFKK
jgi:hypothetical protein